MKITGTLTATLLLSTCLAALADPATARPAPTTLAASAVTSAAAASTWAASTSGASTSGHLLVTLPAVPRTDLVVGDTLALQVTVDSTDATTVRFQTRPDAGSGWTDATVTPAPAGVSSHDFAVPTAQPGAVDVRVVVDPPGSWSTGFTSDPWHFTVAAAPVGLLPSSVSLGAPPSAAVATGARVVLRGRVSGGAGRTAGLELSTPAGWLPLARTSTDADGAYALALPTDWLYRGRLRVRVPATTSYADAATEPFGTAVLPSYTPRGSASDWGLTKTGVRWDPCRGPIRYQVNAGGVPARRLDQLRQALKLVHQATGLDFAYAGTTAAVPFRTDGSNRTHGSADFTIAFVSGRQVRQFRSNVVGLGGFAWQGRAIVHGLVSFDKAARLKDSFGLGQTWGTLMLHEIGHALGLAHADGPEQVMHSGINARSRGSYQAGDLTGLRREGALGGCLAPTAARTSAPRVVVSR